MKIKSIVLENIKGITQRYEFHLVNIITGKNFSGKTAILDALVIAFLGYLPRLGKRNQDTWSLSSGKTMKCLVQTDSGEIGYRFSINSRGAVTKENISTVDMDLPPITLDPGSFHSMTGKQKVGVIMDTLDIGTVADVEKALEYKAVDHPDHWRDGVPDSPQEYFDFLMKSIQEDMLGWKQAQKRMEKTIEGLEWLRREDNPPLDQGKDIEEMVVKIHRLQRDIEVNERLLTERTALVEIIGDQVDDISPGKSASELESAVSETEKELAQARRAEGIEIGIKGLEQELSTLQGQFNRLTNEQIYNLQTECPDLIDDGKKLIDEQSRLAQIDTKNKNLLGRVKEITRQIERVNHMSSCPLCGHEMTDEERSSRVDDLSKQINIIQSEVVDVDGELEKVGNRQTTFSNAKGEYAVLQQQKARNETISENIDRLKIKIQKMQNELDQIYNGSVKHYEKVLIKIKNLHNRRKAWEQLKELGPIREAKYLEEELLDLRKALVELQESQKAFEQHKSDLSRLAQAEEEVETIKNELESMKEFEAKVVLTRMEFVDRAIQPFLDDLNSVLVGVIKSPVEKPATIIGSKIGYYREANQFVQYEAMSGTEQALMLAGLQIAMARNSPIKLVMIDELARLDGNSKDKLEGNIRDLMIAGKFDQFIGVDLNPEGWGNDTKLIIPC